MKGLCDGVLCFSEHLFLWQRDDLFFHSGVDDMGEDKIDSAVKGLSYVMDNFIVNRLAVNHNCSPDLSDPVCGGLPQERLAGCWQFTLLHSIFFQVNVFLCSQHLVIITKTFFFFKKVGTKNGLK
jgi:hypothetical protein